MISDEVWYEVWCDESAEPVYLLLVEPDKSNPGQVLIRDPREKMNVVFRGKSYQEAVDWLQEDEYARIEGRMFPDDGCGE